MDIVERFARALDEEDYGTAAQCLGDDAEYDTGECVIRGAGAILKSFRESAENGRRTFSSVAFTHEIDPNSGSVLESMLSSLFCCAGSLHADDAHQEQLERGHGSSRRASPGKRARSAYGCGRHRTPQRDVRSLCRARARADRYRRCDEVPTKRR